MQIVLVLAGLLSASVMAALIMAMAIPSPETVVEGVYRSAQGVAVGLQTRLEQEMELFRFHTMLHNQGLSRVHQMLRGQGHRRLDEVVSVSKAYTAPSVAPTTTIVIQYEDSVQPSVEASKFTTAAIPAIVLGVSSTVILFAAMLYIMDSRRRVRKHKTREDGRDLDEEENQRSLDRDTMSRSAASETEFYVQPLDFVCYEGSGNLILPPMMDVDNEDEDVPDYSSISRLSTMTESMVDGTTHSDYSFGVVERKLSSTSSVVTVLSRASRLSEDMNLASLMQTGEASPPDSPYSSDSCHGSNHNSPLFAENLAKSNHFNQISFSSSFEHTPTDVKAEQGHETNKASEHGDERYLKADLEDLIARIPFEEMGNTPKVVRVVQIAPVPVVESDFGLHLGSAGPRGHPYVVALDAGSPLLGRIFIGDQILIINGSDTIGVSQGEAMALLQIANCSNLIQITVCSDESSLAQSFFDRDEVLDSFDLGMPDSKTEV